MVYHKSDIWYLITYKLANLKQIVIITVLSILQVWNLKDILCDGIPPPPIFKGEYTDSEANFMFANCHFHKAVISQGLTFDENHRIDSRSDSHNIQI